MKMPFRRNKVVRIAIAIVALMSAAYLVGYYASANSEAFDEARRFIVQSRVASDVLGDVTDVKLTPLGYQLEFAGSSGSASFHVEIKGTRSDGEAVIRLTKTFGAWLVKSATLRANGQERDLMATTAPTSSPTRWLPAA